MGKFALLVHERVSTESYKKGGGGGGIGVLVKANMDCFFFLF